MKTTLVSLSVAALSCLAATSTQAGTDWSFAFGYSSGGFSGAVGVAAPVHAATCVAPAPVRCAPVAHVAWAVPAPVVVTTPVYQPVVPCVATVVVRPVAVCAPAPVYHFHRHHHHHGW